MGEPSTFVGMDVHKQDIAVAMLIEGHTGPVEWRVANEPTAVQRLARKLAREGGGPIHCVYEAGPCGYALQRQLQQLGLTCDVVAPSMIQIRPGEKIKTDRRDARKLAELARARLLTIVRPPTEDEEAVRDLCRGRGRRPTRSDAGTAPPGQVPSALRRGSRLAALLPRHRHPHGDQWRVSWWAIPRISE